MRGAPLSPSTRDRIARASAGVFQRSLIDKLLGVDLRTRPACDLRPDPDLV